MNGHDTLPIPENTLAFAVRETISQLQHLGLLLNQEQTIEYFQLKRQSQDEDLLGKEAAQLLGVAPGTITAYRQQGLIQAKRVGRRWVYSKLALIDFKSKTA